MTKIYHVTEFSKDFVRLTNPPAWKNIADRIGAEFVLYNFPEFSQRKIDRDSSNDAIWVIEAAYPDMSKMSLVELRTYIPNGKLVLLGGDTIFYLRQGSYGLEGIQEADLWLDLMDEVVVFFQKLGIKSDHWIWSGSESIFNQFDEYVNNIPPDLSLKDVDLNCFMTMGTVYRQNMLRFFQQKGLTFAIGAGCEAKNFDEMIEVYRKSWFTLGSTSPSWTTGQRSSKGFRDCAGISLGSLLIYDDFIDIRKKFGGGSIVPLYDYNNFESITHLINVLREDPDMYQYLLRLQREWLRFNTLENQFMRKLTKHNIFSAKSLRDSESKGEIHETVLA